MRLSYWLQYSRKISCCCWCALQYSYIVRFFPIEKHTFAFKRKSTNRWEDPRSTVLPIGHVVGFGELVAQGARSGGAEEDHEWQKLRGMVEQFESLQSSIISYHITDDHWPVVDILGGKFTSKHWMILILTLFHAQYSNAASVVGAFSSIWIPGQDFSLACVPLLSFANPSWLCTLCIT